MIPNKKMIKAKLIKCIVRPNLNTTSKTVRVNQGYF